MSIINLDFETYSEADLRKLGAWAYSRHPSTEIICMAYSIDEQPPRLLTCPEEISQTLKDFFSWPKIILRAWNSFFEMAICANLLGLKQALNPILWSDTAAAAAALALPRGLGDCGQALDIPLDKQKHKRGKYLIQRLCKPQRGQRIQDPKLLQELYEYCRQDVVAEREIAKYLAPLNAQERQVWELDQRINIRGLHIDTQAVDDALSLIQQVTTQLNQEVSQITGGQLTNLNQRQRALDYINQQGCPLIRFDKAYLEKQLATANLAPQVRRLIEIRQQLGKTSLSKYGAFKQMATAKHRVHGLLMYHGAATGRWSGKQVQPQNLPRPAFADIDNCIELFHSRDAELLGAIYDDPLSALSSCLRGMICASQGKRLMVADYSAIEARVLAWLAGQQDALKVFHGHGKIYEHTASQLYGVAIAAVSKPQRFIGKVATLALGYQGGARAFQRMAEIYGEEITTDQAETVKNNWRNTNKNIVRFWWAIEAAAIRAVQQPGKTFIARGIKFAVKKQFLFCRLPSGRLLAYHKPRIQSGEYETAQLTFMGTDSITRKWQRQTTYGGKLVENITQAVARDLLAEAMLRVETAGYNIVLSVHDELIAEVPADFADLKEFTDLMCQLPSWATGLPLSAAGFVSRRYQKS